MNVFKTRWFVRFARQHGIDDAVLCVAIADAQKGLVDADLGGGVIKQRIARPNEGKSGGFRSIILFRLGDKAVFVYGFPKSARGNIRKDELRGFKDLADVMLGYDDAAVAEALKSGVLTEVNCHEKDLPE